MIRRFKVKTRLDAFNMRYEYQGPDYLTEQAEKPPIIRRKNREKLKRKGKLLDCKPSVANKRKEEALQT